LRNGFPTTFKLFDVFPLLLIYQTRLKNFRQDDKMSELQDVM
jgi:hypothetical protein